MDNLGIMQGRLSISPDGSLQYFPQNEWENEFALAQRIGFSHIEIIAEEEFNKRNPIWSKSGIRKIRNKIKETGVQIVCANNNYSINHSLELYNTVKNYKNFIESVSKISVKKVLIPMFGKSRIDDENYTSFISSLVEIADFASKKSILICCEIDLEMQKIITILKDINHHNIFLCYDIGNCTFSGYNVKSEILHGSKYIKHIHIKDKDKSGNNVLLGSGKVDFTEVFNVIKEIQFSSTFTLETSRGNNPRDTAINNYNFIKQKQSNLFYN